MRSDHVTTTAFQTLFSIQRATKMGTRVLWLLCWVLGCSSTSAPPPMATVRFTYANQLCAGTSVTLQFLIDRVVVDTATLRDGQTSPAYVTTVGSHLIGAHLSGSGLSLVHDTTVNLDAGEAFTRHVQSITPEC